MTKTAVSPMIVAGARLMMVKPPSRRSDTVIGAERRQAARSAARPAAGPPRRPRPTGAAPSAAASGAAHSTAPFYWPGPRRARRRPTRHTGRRGGLRRVRPTATASPTSTTTGTATSPTSTRAPRGSPRWPRRGGGPVLELGVGLGPAGPPAGRARASRCTASTRRRRCSARLRAKPGGDAVHADRRRHGRPRPGRPAARSRWCSSPSTRSSTSATAEAAAARASSGSPTLLAPGRRCFVVEAFVPARRRRRRRRRRRSTPRRITADEVVLSVSQHDDGAPDDHRPAHPRHRGRASGCARGTSATPRPRELDAMAEAAGLALAWRHADWDGRRRSDPTRASTCPRYRRGNVRAVLPPGSA